MRIRRWTIKSRVNHRPHLPHLDQKLWRIGWNDQHIGMRLDQDACIAFVHVAHFVARRHCLRNPFFQVRRLPDPQAIRTMPAEVGKSIAFRRLKTIHRLRQHQRKRVLARTLRSGKNQRLRKVTATQPLPQVPDGRSVAMKTLESHPSSLRHGHVPKSGSL